MCLVAIYMNFFEKCLLSSAHFFFTGLFVSVIELYELREEVLT